MVFDEGQRPMEVADRLGLDRDKVKNWLYTTRLRRAAAGHMPAANSEASSSDPQQPSLEDFRRLEREVRRLTQERDILKKAMAYFVELPK